jgi:hypothetical protein
MPFESPLNRRAFRSTHRFARCTRHSCRGVGNLTRLEQRSVTAVTANGFCVVHVGTTNVQSLRASPRRENYLQLTVERDKGAVGVPVLIQARSPAGDTRELMVVQPNNDSRRSVLCEAGKPARQVVPIAALRIGDRDDAMSSGCVLWLQGRVALLAARTTMHRRALSRRKPACRESRSRRHILSRRQASAATASATASGRGGNVKFRLVSKQRGQRSATMLCPAIATQGRSWR